MTYVRTERIEERPWEESRWAEEPLGERCLHQWLIGSGGRSHRGESWS